jgi:hypothetical protein
MFLTMLTAVRHYILLQTHVLHFISLYLNILVTASPQGSKLTATSTLQNRPQETAHRV